MNSDRFRFRITALLVPLMFLLGGCPAPADYYYDDDDATTEDMVLTVNVTNSTGYPFDGLGIGLDLEPSIVTLSALLNDGEFTVVTDTWLDWGWGRSLSVTIRARDTDGDCYRGNAQTTTGADITVDANVTGDWYEGGGCP